MTVLTVAIAVLVSVMAFLAILVIGMLVVEQVASNGIEPRFTCSECEHFEDNRCKRCVEGVSGEPRSCARVRGTLKCLAGARRAK